MGSFPGAVMGALDILDWKEQGEEGGSRLWHLGRVSGWALSRGPDLWLGNSACLWWHAFLPRKDPIVSPFIQGFPRGSGGKESACSLGDLGSIPGLGRSPGEGTGHPLQYSGLENSMDCTVHGVRHDWATFTFTSLYSSPPRNQMVKGTQWWSLYWSTLLSMEPRTKE